MQNQHRSRGDGVCTEAMVMRLWWGVDGRIPVLHGLRRQLGQQDSVTLFDSNTMSRELVIGREPGYRTYES